MKKQFVMFWMGEKTRYDLTRETVCRLLVGNRKAGAYIERTIDGWLISDTSAYNPTRDAVMLIGRR